MAFEDLVLCLLLLLNGSIEKQLVSANSLVHISKPNRETTLILVKKYIIIEFHNSWYFT